MLKKIKIKKESRDSTNGARTIGHSICKKKKMYLDYISRLTKLKMFHRPK